MLERTHQKQDRHGEEVNASNATRTHGHIHHTQYRAPHIMKHSKSSATSPKCESSPEAIPTKVSETQPVCHMTGHRTHKRGIASTCSRWNIDCNTESLWRGIQSLAQTFES